MLALKRPERLEPDNDGPELRPPEGRRLKALDLRARFGRRELQAVKDARGFWPGWCLLLC